MINAVVYVYDRDGAAFASVEVGTSEMENITAHQPFVELRSSFQNKDLSPEEYVGMIQVINSIFVHVVS